MNPDFICIGAQKAGTSWLYHALNEHPGVSGTPVKEFHYFDLPTPLPTVLVTAHRRRARTHIRKMYAARTEGRLDEYRWLARYLFGIRTDDWYARLFEPARPTISEDFTPSYARLSDDVVHRMARRFPDTRIIYILRHPVERIWSQAKMDLGRRGKLENASKRSVRRYLEREDVVANSDYAANLERWTSHFGAERVHVEFLEAITADPHASLARLCRFLELEYSTSLFSRSIESARNTTPRTPIPPDVHVWLARRQLEPACALHAYLDCENSFAYLRDIERVALGMGT